MNINGMPRMLGALCIAAIVTGVSAIAPTVFAQPASSRNNDDAIVRDLKAGKLTVREAELLRDRNASRNSMSTAPAHASVPVPHKTMPLSRPGKAAHAGKPERLPKKGMEHKPKAPIHHATQPHPHHPAKEAVRPKHSGSRKELHSRHAERGHGVTKGHEKHSGHAAEEGHAKHVKKHPKPHARPAKVAAADNQQALPRRQAVKYIR